MAETFAQTVRQIWIDAVLTEDGELNRGHICDAFFVSIPQASVDLRKYMSANPHRLFYDNSGRIYRTVEGSKAAFSPAAHEAAFAIVMQAAYAVLAGKSHG